MAQVSASNPEVSYQHRCVNLESKGCSLQPQEGAHCRRPQGNGPPEEQERQDCVEEGFRTSKEEFPGQQAAEVVQGSSGGPQGPRCEGIRCLQEGLSFVQQSQVFDVNEQVPGALLERGGDAMTLVCSDSC